jgi:nicotinic acid mononucleotide adenylyltransferase
MSGGRFNYLQYRLFDIEEEIQKIIKNNNVTDEWGYSHSYSEETLEKFREAIHTLDRARNMAQRIDYLVSGDDSQESFHKRWKEDVEKPYLKNHLTIKENAL